MPTPRWPDSPSLVRRFALVHACIGVLTLLVGAFVLYATVTQVVSEQHQRSVIASASEVLQRLSHDGVAALDRPLSADTRRRFDANGSMRYLVLDPSGRILAASPGSQPSLPRLDGSALPEVFESGQDGSRLWGVTRRVATPSGPVYVQVAQDMDRSYIVLDDIAPAALWPMLTLLAVGAALLFVANTTSLLLMLRPLRRAARQAARIGGPGNARLDEAHMPEEVRPLIQAVNGGLDRLDDALAWQRGFSEEVAHELRTPLAILQAELDLLEPGTTRDRLIRDVEELSQLVTDLLEAAEAAREMPAGQEAVDLAELAADTTRRLDPIASRNGRHVVMRRRVPEAPVRGDRAALGRALRNLVENALAHTPAGTAVEVRVLPTPEGEVRVEVADRGPGVPQAERGSVFRRHWRAGDTHRKGLGLGLAIVERIVRAHGGRVEVGDNPGGGAVFAIALPQDAVAAE